ncbi:hypothetical protein SEA_KOZIE_66 [Microbacterium phage Kozie]|uniref:Uncharacterized protein n=1 Tax=Microbacterium phage Kozie TaxID=2885981 RepID=A0AAE9C369_9CAUD|nr:hypothetical protein QC998_gp66 [Microbacterium phage Kozie]UDL16262.1 hypothetical protein SEA_KOZIE_66 [Microbacterium phage Kozie]
MAEPEAVPTAAQLVAMGSDYAEAVGWTQKRKSDPATPTFVRIHPKGHALLGEIMARNAAAALARGDGDWHPEPPHTRPRVVAPPLPNRKADQ